MGKAKKDGICRREFARRVAVASAATLVPTAALPVPDATAEPPRQSAETAQLSPEARAETDARYQAIMGLYGSRFSETQKAEIRRLCTSAQPTLDRLRAYHIENSDNPALYLKPLLEREKTFAEQGSHPLAGSSKP